MLCADTLTVGGTYGQRQERLTVDGIEMCWCFSISSVGGCPFAQDSLRVFYIQ